MKIRSPKAVTTLGASTMTLALILGMAGISTAADNTSTAGQSAIYTGIPSNINPNDKAAFEAQDKWTGNLAFTVSAADDAALKAIGFDLNLEESARITNEFNDSATGLGYGGSAVLLAPKIDAATVKANSPYAAHIDTETPIVDADGVQTAVGFSLRDDNMFDLRNNITTKEFQTKPSLEAGQFTSGGAGQYGPTTTNRTQVMWAADGSVEKDTGAYFGNVYAFPSTDNTAGGLPGDKKDNLGYGATSGGSVFQETDYIDARLPSEQRTADVSLGGVQRTQDVSTRTDIVTNNGQMGFYLQPMASGKRTDGSEQIGSVALLPPVWVTATSTRKKELPTYTASSPLVTTTTDGSKVKVWYEPSDLRNTPASSLLVTTGYDFFDASIPLVPTDKAIYDEFHGNEFAGTFNFAQLVENYEAPGSFNFETSYSSTYFDAKEELTAVANDVSAEEAKVAGLQARLDADKVALDAANADVVVAEDALAQGIADGVTGSALFKLEGDASSARMAQNEAQGNFNDSEARLADAQTALATAKDAPAKNYKLTYTKVSMNNGADIPKTWAQNGVPMEVGQTWTSTVNEYDATFTVESNANGVLVIDAKVDSAPTVPARVQSAGQPSIGTGTFVMGSGEIVQAPGYEARYIIVEPTIPTPDETPEIPTPEETPEIPTPEETPEIPTPEETPTDTPVSITEKVEDPGAGITDKGEEDFMAKTPGPANLADTGSDEGNFTIIGGILVFGGLLVALGARLSRKKKLAVS